MVSTALQHNVRVGAIFRIAAGAISLNLAFSGGMVLAQSRAETVPFGQAMQGTVTMDDVIISIRTTLIALDQANKTENYSVFRDLASDEFKKNSLENVASLFAPLRRDQIDLSRAVSIDPIVTIAPEVISNGMLRVAGYFPSMPEQIHFDFLFVQSNGSWKLFGIYVGSKTTEPMRIGPIEVKPNQAQGRR